MTIYLTKADLTFRRVMPEDLLILNQLIREGKAYWGYPEAGIDRFMDQFGISDISYFKKSFGFILESSEGVIGTYIFSSDESGPMLDHLFLNTQFIGQGYGRQLWDHCVESARKKGWELFTFWADPNALEFYEHMGAIKIGERPMITLTGHMAPIMQFNILDVRN